MKCGVFDIGCQLSGWFGGVITTSQATILSWIPDWAWPLLPWWPVLVIVGGAGMAYRFAGWPGVVAFFTGVGFIAGRKSVKVPEPVVPQNGGVSTSKPAPIPVPRKRPTTPQKPESKTLKDLFSGLGKIKF